MDQALFYFFYHLPRQDAGIYALVIFLADGLPYFVIFGALAFLLFHKEFFANPFQSVLKKFKELFFVFGSAGAAWIAAHVLKMVINTARPFDALPDVTSLFAQTGYAFPSGHATFFAALATAIFYLHRKAGYVFMLLALLIGIARIMAGVHFPGDILGGLALGALVAYIAKKAYNSSAI